MLNNRPPRRLQAPRRKLPYIVEVVLLLGLGVALYLLFTA